MFRTLIVMAITCVVLIQTVFAQEEGAPATKDSSAGLPRPYASKYLVASSTLSPDKKLAVIYPNNADNEKAKDYLVSLTPFKILTPLATKWPYFAHQSNAGLRAGWSPDNSVALITIDSKWGPGDIFLYEISDGKVVRSTNLTDKVSALLKPDYDKVKPEPYNDSVEFIFDSDMVEGSDKDEGDLPQEFKLNGSTVVVNTAVTTDPKHIGGIKAWDAKFKGIWDIPQAKFTSQKVTRIFGGKRKDD
jgi:hypothetical protein